MGVISDTIGTLDGKLLSFTETMFGGFAGSLAEVFQLGGAVSVGIIGVNMVLQVFPMSIAAASFWMMRWSIIFLVSTSWANFGALYAMVTVLPNEIAAQFLASATGDTTPAELYLQMDKVVDTLLGVATKANAQSGMLGVSLVGVAVAIIGWFMAAVTVLVIALGKVGLAVMVTLAPLALFASLYKPTQELFSAWSRTTVGFALIPVVTAGVLALVVSLGNDAANNASSATVSTIGDVTNLIVVTICAIFLTARIPQIVQGLAGTIVATGSGLLETKQAATSSTARFAGRQALRGGKAVGGVVMTGATAGTKAVRAHLAKPTEAQKKAEMERTSAVLEQQRQRGRAEATIGAQRAAEEWLKANPPMKKS